MTPDFTGRPRPASPARHFNPGDYYAIPGPPFVTFGVILPPADAAEAAFFATTGNRRRVRAFSAAAPNGEEGRALVAGMVEITAAEFGQARAAGWT